MLTKTKDVSVASAKRRRIQSNSQILNPQTAFQIQSKNLNISAGGKFYERASSRRERHRLALMTNSAASRIDAAPLGRRGSRERTRRMISAADIAGHSKKEEGEKKDKREVASTGRLGFKQLRPKATGNRTKINSTGGGNLYYRISPASSTLYQKKQNRHRYLQQPIPTRDSKREAARIKSQKHCERDLGCFSATV